MSDKVEKPGDPLERLVAVIERAVATSGSVVVERKKRIRDKDTGSFREHDVVLTFKESHHEMVMAIECKERSRKTGVPELEGFYAKCQRTGIDRGIMVSRLGFTETALKKAASYNIGCLTLEQAEGFDWCLAPGIELRHRETRRAYIGVDPLEKPPAGAILVNENGEEITLEKIKQIGVRSVSELGEAPPEIEEPGKDINCRFVDESPTFALKCPDGRIIGLRRLVLDVTYRLVADFMPFEFSEYVDRASNKQLYTAAIGRVDLPGISGHLTMIRDEIEGIRISFVPQAATNAEKVD